MQYSVHILDSSNSFLRSYTPVPSAIFLSVTDTICLEFFLHWFLCYSHLSMHSYFIKLHWKLKEIRTSEVIYPWPQLNTAYFFRDDKRFPYRVRDSLPHLKIYIIIQILKKLSHLYKSYFLKYNSRYFSHFSIYKSLWNSRLCHLDSKSKMNVHNQKHFVWSSEFYSSFVFLSSFLHEIEIIQISELSFRSHLGYTPYLWLWWTSNSNQLCLIKSTRSNVLVTT